MPHLDVSIGRQVLLLTQPHEGRREHEQMGSCVLLQHNVPSLHLKQMESEACTPQHVAETLIARNTAALRDTMMLKGRLHEC